MNIILNTVDTPRAVFMGGELRMPVKWGRHLMRRTSYV
jgi:hypothetical protein